MGISVESTEWLLLPLGCFQIEMEFGNVGFCGGRKTGVPGEKPSEQRREPTTNSTHIWRQHRESNPGHSGGRLVLSPLRHPTSLAFGKSLQCSSVFNTASWSGFRLSVVKTKTKVITLTNYKQGNSAMNQSEFEANAYNRRQARDIKIRVTTS